MIRIYVTKLDGTQIWGALNIGPLTKTNIIRTDGNHIFVNEKGEQVYCSLKMYERIMKRLKENGF